MFETVEKPFAQLVTMSATRPEGNSFEIVYHLYLDYESDCYSLGL